MFKQIPAAHAAHLFWRASRILRSTSAARTAPADGMVEAALCTMIDLAGFLREGQPAVAGRAAALLEEFGIRIPMASARDGECGHGAMGRRLRP